MKSIKQSKTKYVLMAQSFFFSLRLSKALFGGRIRRWKVGWDRWTLALIFSPLGMCIFFPRTPLMGLLKCCMKRLVDLLPLPQSIILSLLDSSQGDSGSIYHIYSHPQAPSVAWSIFFASQHSCLTFI